MSTEIDGPQPVLAGLELVDPRVVKPSAMRAAVVATISALGDISLLEPRHAALCQLALELADSVTAGRASGRASAAAMAAAQLRETLLALPSPQQAAATDAFNTWVEKMLDEDDE